MSKRGNPLDPTQAFLTQQYDDVFIAGKSFEFDSPAAVRVDGSATYQRGLLLSFNTTTNIFEGMSAVSATSLPIAVLGEDLINTTAANKDFERVVLVTGHVVFDKLFLYDSTTKKCVPVTSTTLPLARIIDLIPRNIIVHKPLK